MNENALTPRKDGALALVDQHFEDVIPRLHELHAELFRHVIHSPNRVRPLSTVITEAEAIVAFGELDRVAAAVAAGSAPANIGEIGAHLARLIAAFPNASRAPLQAYGETLAEDVGDARPSRFALASACRRLRRTCDFLPTICEALEAVRDEESRLRCARHVIERLTQDLDRARAITLRDAPKLIAETEDDDDDDDELAERDDELADEID